MTGYICVRKVNRQEQLFSSVTITCRPLEAT